MFENSKRERPKFPKRAIVTFGMPYGNKEIHFGHLFGMILSADFFARFLRNRIGSENVILQSGTDCYGSTMTMAFDKAKENGANYETVEDLVKDMHGKTLKVLEQAQMQVDFFGASAFGDAKEEHIKVSQEFFNSMYNTGLLKKMGTEQFYDEKLGCFLNGRQVVGKCPYEGCKSEKAYADECDMCHQYLPKDLIDPVSVLSGEKPILKSILNWYFDITKYNDLLLEIVNKQEKDRRNRKFVTREIREFLKKPEVYIKNEYKEKWEEIQNLVPNYILLDDGAKKSSFTIQFNCLEDREKACNIMNEKGIKFRNGKTLVPFRITGNIEWGVPVPNVDGMENRTFYVWPESLWAPISFTRTYLKNATNVSSYDWKDWWCSKDSEIFQVFAEDNMYFYGPPEQAMFLSTQGKNPTIDTKDGQLSIPHMIVNKHSLYMGLKASSSGKYRAPLAKELFEHYTVEQLRMHFLGLGFGETNANVELKAFNPDAKKDEIDPALKEGNILINVYNRVIRKLSYFVNENFEGVIPLGDASTQVKEICEKEILNHEDKVYCYKFHVALNMLDAFIRNINKFFERESKMAKDGGDEQKIKQVVIDTIYMIRVANTLLNPFIPQGSQKVADYFHFNTKWTDWNYIFDDINVFIDKNTKIELLEDENPFFKKHPSQI